MTRNATTCRRHRTPLLLAAVALALGSSACRSSEAGAARVPVAPGSEHRARAAVDGIARWLRVHAVEAEVGVTWPAAPESRGEAPRPSTNLYSGSPGVVLFFLERHRATGGAQPADLEVAVRGGDALLRSLDETAGPSASGLYVGRAGIGFVLDALHGETGEPRFREGADAVADWLEETARATETGVTWNGVTDVIAGSAGTGLWLVQRWRRHADERALALARRAGDELLAAAEPTSAGSSWRMRTGDERTMPNFSHGTAGVAYFLVELHRALVDAGEPTDGRYLAAARAGADQLRSFLDGAPFVPHHLPGGEDLFYLGWCHGPPGTARLFQRLFEVTGDASYREDVERLADALASTPIPDEPTPGFWNNVGVCCGSAGVAWFLADLGLPRHRALIEAMTGDLLDRATTDADGTRWVQAEHRVRPELLEAQTGLMQGAAGIGLWLLRVAYPSPPGLDWPDSPWDDRP